MGTNARIVVTGDTSQVDLPSATVSGLADAVERLRNVPGIGVSTLDRSDIVRHPLVQAIVNAYEETEPDRRADSELPQRADSEPPPERSGPPASE
jgi:phosphate starvation-inducible PhoH-like protein